MLFSFFFMNVWTKNFLRLEEDTAMREARSEATSGRLLVMQVGDKCEERSNELKGCERSERKVKELLE